MKKIDEIENELTRRVTVLEDAAKAIRTSGISSTREIEMQIEIYNALLKWIKQ